MKKPNLFIIGTRKTGTSALYMFLKKHPEIFMSDPKELHFFDQEKLGDFEEYLSHFKNASSETYVGEASPSYFQNSFCPKRLYEFNSDSKLILILREPTAYLRSYYSHSLRGEQKSVENIDDFVFKDERMKDNLVLSDYKRFLKRYLKYFSKDQIKVLIYEDYKKNNKKAYEEVLKFLGLEYFDIEFTKYNESLRVRFKWLGKIVRDYSLGQILHVFPTTIRDKILDFLKGPLLKVEENKYKSKNKQYFKENFIKINKFLNEKGFIDDNLIEKWGYNDL